MPAVTNPVIKAYQLTLTQATSKIVPGATSLSLRNNADSADNVLVSDAGLMTVRAGVTLTAGDVTVAATAKLRLDGSTSGDTYITEASANVVHHYAGGASRWIVSLGGVGTYSTVPLWYDGGGNTYTVESAADVLDTYAGGTIYLRVSGGNGIYYFNQPTTGSAANAFLDSGTGLLSRSTSSLRYKDMTGELSLDEAWRLVDGARAITYTPKGGGREHIGLAAEWMHELDPRITTVDAEGRPDWVQYPHLTAPLMVALADVKRRMQAAGIWS